MDFCTYDMLLTVHVLTLSLIIFFKSVWHFLNYSANDENNENLYKFTCTHTYAYMSTAI